MKNYRPSNLHATTILCVKKNHNVVIGGDGQVTLGSTVMKSSAVKIRKLYNNTVLTGFAGAVADAFTLYERFEKKLDQFQGDILRACVELTSEWRMDKYLRNLEAMLIIANKDKLLLLAGSGEVIESEDSVLAIGSGGEFARSAALALIRNTEMSAREIVKKSMEIASDICVYTNKNINIKEIHEERSSKSSAKTKK